MARSTHTLHEVSWHNRRPSATILPATSGASVSFPRSAVLSACITLLSPLAASLSQAQQPAPPPPAASLQEILLHLQENYWDYLSNVPDFFADEHVTSVLKQEGSRDVKTTTDSVFRLQRVASIGEG